MARSMARLGTPPFETLSCTITPVMVDMSVTVLLKLGDDGVDIEKADVLDAGAVERFRRGGRPGDGLQRRDDVVHGAAPIAELDEPMNQGADLDPFRTMGGSQDVAPGERSFGQNGFPLDTRAGRQHGHEIT